MLKNVTLMKKMEITLVKYLLNDCLYDKIKLSE